MIQEANGDRNHKSKSNAEIIEETYREYHGKYEDGITSVPIFEKLEGRRLA